MQYKESLGDYDSVNHAIVQGSRDAVHDAVRYGILLLCAASIVMAFYGKRVKEIIKGVQL